MNLVNDTIPRFNDEIDDTGYIVKARWFTLERINAVLSDVKDRKNQPGHIAMIESVGGRAEDVEAVKLLENAEARQRETVIQERCGGNGFLRLFYASAYFCGYKGFLHGLFAWPASG